MQVRSPRLRLLTSNGGWRTAVAVIHKGCDLTTQILWCLLRGMRNRRPHRSLHLIEIENLLGAPRPTLAAVRAARAAYEAQVTVGPDDLVVVACNHGAALPVGLAFEHSRLVVRSGPDGADLALLQVLDEHNLGRFDRVVVASGDGAFTLAVARLASLGLEPLVVSRPRALARSLRMACGGRVVAFHPFVRSQAPAPAPEAA